MRKHYTIGDATFVCRVIDVSDVWALHGKLPILPTSTRDDAEGLASEIATQPEKMMSFLDFADRVLVRCGITPKFIAESPDPIPFGCQPVKEIEPFVRLELCNALMADAGFTKEAAQATRPSSETSAAS
jgi:hypothetical protein